MLSNFIFSPCLCIVFKLGIFAKLRIKIRLRYDRLHRKQWTAEHRSRKVTFSPALFTVLVVLHNHSALVKLLAKCWKLSGYSCEKKTHEVRVLLSNHTSASSQCPVKICHPSIECKKNYIRYSLTMFFFFICFVYCSF